VLLHNPAALGVVQRLSGRVKSKNRGGSCRSRACSTVCWPGVVAVRWANWPALEARVTRCIRSSSRRRLRQVSPVAFSITRRSSSASQHSWMWARMRSSR
jgi:hypothetical protein